MSFFFLHADLKTASIIIPLVSFPGHCAIPYRIYHRVLYEIKIAFIVVAFLSEHNIIWYIYIIT